MATVEVNMTIMMMNMTASIWTDMTNMKIFMTNMTQETETTAGGEEDHQER